MEFNPARLTLARKRRGMTKTSLAGEVGVTLRSISMFENGEEPPSGGTLQRLSIALKFPVEFFSGPEVDEPQPEAASFRAQSKMTASQRDAALSSGAVAWLLNDWIERRFALPRPSIPEPRWMPPEEAAYALRAEWGLGEASISNMVHLLESRGVRVFSLVQECKEVDAFSLWRNGVPFVFLNTMKSGERSRFDAAHELGHLVLHQEQPCNGRVAEQEADLFASAFLMPRRAVLAAPHVSSLEGLIRLKVQWGVSVAALAYRLHALGRLTDWQYRTLCIEMSKAGYRSKEPDGIRRESSVVLEKVFRQLAVEGIKKSDVARELNIATHDLEALVFGLVLTSLKGGQTEGSPERSKSKANLYVL